MNFPLPECLHAFGALTGSCPTGQAASHLDASRCDPARKRTAENNFGCDDPNDPITRAQIESAFGYLGDDQ